MLNTQPERNLLDTEQYPRHRQLLRTDTYTASDVWNYIYLLTWGRGSPAYKSSTTREEIEEERRRLIANIPPPTASDLSNIEELVGFWSLSVVLYAIEAAVASVDGLPSWETIRRCLPEARGHVRRMLLDEGIRLK